MAGHSTETEIGGKEWKFAEVTMPHCHLANLYQESAFESGIPRKAKANGSKLYRHVANSLARRGKVTVEGSSKWRKIMPGSWPGSRYDPACCAFISAVWRAIEIVPCFCQFAKSHG